MIQCLLHGRRFNASEIADATSGYCAAKKIYCYRCWVVEYIWLTHGGINDGKAFEQIKDDCTVKEYIKE